LLEVADVFVVNKADRPGAKSTARDLRFELNLADDSRSWRPPIVLASAATGEGLEEVLAAAEQHRAHLESTGELAERRRARLLGELRAIVRELTLERVDRELTGQRMTAVAERMFDRRVDPLTAAHELMNAVADGSS
jgi:LAO/AO transport system kinase